MWFNQIQLSATHSICMKTIRPILFVLLVGLMLSACEVPKVYFSQGMRKTVKSTGRTAKDLQFYVDTDVELRRELVSDTVQITNGKLVLENGKYYQVIKLKKFTPGICILDTSATILRVAFDDTDDKYLTFGIPDARNDGSVYSIFADEWRNKQGKVIYEGKEFWIQPSGAYAQLMIAKSEKKSLEAKTRVMKGRKVN